MIPEQRFDAGGRLIRLGELPGAWVMEARCAEVDPDVWFPEKGGSTYAAKAICRECPVKTQCLEYALRNREREGIWGGLSTRERVRLWAKGNAA